MGGELKINTSFRECFKTVLITGGSRGFGQAIAMRLHEHGFKVLNISTSKSKNPAFEAEYALDLANHDALLEQVRVLDFDILINNAGVYLDDDRFEDKSDVSAQALKRTLDVNLSAPVLLSRLFLERMEQRCKGIIVNVSSGLGRFDEMSNDSLYYRLSKLALNGLTQAISIECSSIGKFVCCYAYCPGRLNTDMGRGGSDVQQAATEFVVLLESALKSQLNGRFMRGSTELSFLSKL